MEKLVKIVKEVIAIALSLIVAIPLYLVIVNSFKDQAEAADFSLAMPTKWNIIENYTRVIRESKIPLALFNSLIVTVFSIILIMLLCSISAFVIARRSDWLSGFLKKMMLGGLVIPVSVVTTYFLMHALKLTGTYYGVILLYVATAYPFSTFLFIGYFNNISREIDESAMIDGSGGIRLFYTVIFPIMKPIVATAVILNFVGVWNDFGLAIYFFNEASRYTLTLTAYFYFGQYSSDWNLVFADLVMVSMPVIVLYLFLQKYIISGLTAGAIKG